MKMPTPDPVGSDADALKPDILAAVSERRWSDAVSVSVRASFVTALNICRDSGIPAPRPSETSLLAVCRAFCDACDNYLATNESDFRVVVARDAFDAIAVAQEALRGPVGDRPPTDVVAHLLLIGGRLGHADVMLGLVTSGLMAEYGTAVHALYERGAHLRDRVPDWEEGFMPVAESFCRGKAKVTYGALVSHARGWRDAEIAAGRNPGVPATDDGIKAGIKRMQRRGLIIPGK